MLSQYGVVDLVTCRQTVRIFLCISMDKKICRLTIDIFNFCFDGYKNMMDIEIYVLFLPNSTTPFNFIEGNCLAYYKA